MMNARRFIGFLNVVALVAASPALAQKLQKDQPLEISSDKVYSYQDQNKAVFSGNVIAVQGTTNLRAGTMTVFYRSAGAKGTEQASGSTGITRLEADTGVVFTTPTDTAMGDHAVYNVATDTIDLIGSNVTLTQGQNILKGTHVTHNMATGRSVMTSGGGAQTNVKAGTGAKGSRVHGVFIPQNDQKAGAK